MTIDCNKKQAIFISKIHSLNQEFYFDSPDDILKLHNIYCTLRNLKFSSNKICWSTGLKYTLAESFVKFC